MGVYRIGLEFSHSPAFVFPAADDTVNSRPQEKRFLFSTSGNKPDFEIPFFQNLKVQIGREQGQKNSLRYAWKLTPNSTEVWVPFFFKNFKLKIAVFVINFSDYFQTWRLLLHPKIIRRLETSGKNSSFFRALFFASCTFLAPGIPRTKPLRLLCFFFFFWDSDNFYIRVHVYNGSFIPVRHVHTVIKGHCKCSF